MQVMHLLRLYHATLSTLVVIAYATGGDTSVHIWLGYGVAAVITIRLASALAGIPQLGLMRFYPHFHGLRLGTMMTHPAISRTLILGIATALIGVTLTGMTMDRGHALGISGQAISGAALADDVQRKGPDNRAENDEKSVVEESHEALANLLVFLIITHVAYLLLFKRPLVLFMLFSQAPMKSNQTP